MHELSVAGAIVDTAVRHASGRRVASVQVRCGGLRQVVPESLEFYFEHVARDTLCEGARLELELVPVRLECSPCANAWELDDAPLFRCPRCGASEVAVVSGDELQVESIEVEEEDACIASG
jgi:hydrogenase nickel incorporation protein HypA/HybF